MSIQVKTHIPGLPAANRIMAQIKSLGIHDVELVYDVQIGIWAVVQVFKPSGKILLMNSSQYQATKPVLLWWIKDTASKYREPNDQDLHDIVVTVKRAQVVFDKGSDWLVDKIEADEQSKYDENRRKQSERIRSIAKPMKKAIRKELG